MNRSDLTDAVANEAGLSKTAANAAVVAFINQVQEAVARGEKVTLTGFGTFDSLKTSERTGRNPQTGAPVTISAGVRPKFIPGKGFRDAVNK